MKGGSVSCFLVVMVASISAFLLQFFCNPAEGMNVFFGRLDDFSADFFNVLRYIAERDPYHNELNGPGEKCYLPLAYVMLYPFSTLQDYANMTLADCYHSRVALMSGYLFGLFSALTLFHSCVKLCGNKGLDFLLPTLFLSSIFLFSTERGNLAVLSAAFVNYFIAFHDTPRRSHRLLGLTALCIAATIKVYPAIFGLLLLRGRRWRAVGFCIVVTLLLVFLPFLFFNGGLENVEQLLRNLTHNSASYGPWRGPLRFGVPPLLHFVCDVLRVSREAMPSIMAAAKAITALAAMLSVYLSIRDSDNWRSVALLTFVVIELPAHSAFYCGLYIFPVVVLFFKRPKSYPQPLEWAYTLLMCLVLSPYQVVVKGMPINAVLSNIAVLTMWGVTMAAAVGDLCRRKRPANGQSRRKQVPSADIGSL